VVLGFAADGAALLQHLGQQPDRRQRRLQLVRDVGQELRLRGDGRGLGGGGAPLRAERHGERERQRDGRERPQPRRAGGLHAARRAQPADARHAGEGRRIGGGGVGGQLDLDAPRPARQGAEFAGVHDAPVEARQRHEAREMRAGGAGGIVGLRSISGIGCAVGIGGIWCLGGIGGISVRGGIDEAPQQARRHRHQRCARRPRRRRRERVLQPDKAGPARARLLVRREPRAGEADGDVGGQERRQRRRPLRRARARQPQRRGDGARERRPSQIAGRQRRDLGVEPFAQRGRAFDGAAAFAVPGGGGEHDEALARQQRPGQQVVERARRRDVVAGGELGGRGAREPVGDDGIVVERRGRRLDPTDGGGHDDAAVAHGRELAPRRVHECPPARRRLPQDRLGHLLVARLLGQPRCLLQARGAPRLQHDGAERGDAEPRQHALRPGLRDGGLHDGSWDAGAGPLDAESIGARAPTVLVLCAASTLSRNGQARGGRATRALPTVPRPSATKRWQRDGARAVSWRSGRRADARRTAPGIPHEPLRTARWRAVTAMRPADRPRRRGARRSAWPVATQAPSLRR
jgi:hypothetical protein